MAEKKTVQLTIAKEEDRTLIASVLLKNGYPCEIVRDKKRKADGTPTTATQLVLIVDRVEEAAWQ